MERMRQPGRTQRKSGEPRPASKATPHPGANRFAEAEALLIELPAEGIDLNAFLHRMETRLIDQALERTGGNRMRASALLGLNRTTLIEKLRRRERE